MFMGKTHDPEEIKKLVEAIRKAGERILSSKEATLAMLVRTGMHTKTGRVKKRFRVKKDAD
jgi:hypothetical protein